MKAFVLFDDPQGCEACPLGYQDDGVIRCMILGLMERADGSAPDGCPLIRISDEAAWFLKRMADRG